MASFRNANQQRPGFLTGSTLVLEAACRAGHGSTGQRLQSQEYTGVQNVECRRKLCEQLYGPFFLKVSALVELPSHETAYSMFDEGSCPGGWWLLDAF